MVLVLGHALEQLRRGSPRRTPSWPVRITLAGPAGACARGRVAAGSARDPSRASPGRRARAPRARARRPRAARPRRTSRPPRARPGGPPARAPRRCRATRPAARLLSDRKRSASSERLCAVMSSITLIAIRRKPSPVVDRGGLHDGPALLARGALAEADDRLALALAGTAPGGRAAARPGTASPDSSKRSKRARISAGGVAIELLAGREAERARAPRRSRRSRLPSGAWPVTASAMPLSMASSSSRARVASRRARASSPRGSARPAEGHRERRRRWPRRATPTRCCSDPNSSPASPSGSDRARA